MEPTFPPRAYFSDRGRSFQGDRGWRFKLILDALRWTLEVPHFWPVKLLQPDCFGIQPCQEANRIGHYFSVLFVSNIIADHLTTGGFIQPSCWFDIDGLRTKTRGAGVDGFSCNLTLEHNS